MNILKKILFILCLFSVSAGFAVNIANSTLQDTNKNTTIGPPQVQGNKPNQSNQPHQNYQKRSPYHQTTSQHPSTPRNTHPSSSYRPQKFSPSGGGGTGY
jgi:hypothetical protein